MLSWLFPDRKRRVARARECLGRGQFAEACRLAAPLADRDPEAAAIAGEAERALMLIDQGGTFPSPLAQQSWASLPPPRATRADTAWSNARFCLRRLASLRRRPPMQPRPTVELAEDGRTVTVVGIPPPRDPRAPTQGELRRTLDVLREVYPADLHTWIDSGGEDLARAVVVLEHVALDRGVAALLDLGDDNPVVCYELARAAISLGELAAAEAALTAFARLAGGHRVIGGGTHTAVLLAEIAVERGRRSEALAALREARAAEPRLADGLFVKLLFETGRLDEAEAFLAARADDPALMPLRLELRVRRYPSTSA